MLLDAGNIILRAIGVIMDATDKMHGNLFEFGVNLGLSFQIKDDCQDFKGDEIKIGKKKGADIASNVITGPLLVAIKSKSNDKLLKIAQKRRLNANTDYILRQITECNGVNVCSDISQLYNNHCFEVAKKMKLNSRNLFSIVRKASNRED